MIVCPQCGAELSGGRFCVRCGSLLPEFPNVDASDKNSGFGAYMIKRTILFAIKIVLFAIVWVLSPKFYPDLVDGASAYFGVDERIFGLLLPIVAYAIAALICAPFKIALTVRRLEGRLSLTFYWFLAWGVTIFARLWIVVLCPVGFFSLLFYDSGPMIYAKIILYVVLLGPFVAGLAYALELIMLWKPGVKFRDLRKSFRSV